MTWHFLDISYKCSHEICGLLYLASYSYFVSDHTGACIRIFFFFFLVLMNHITHMDIHISLIHSSIVGSLGHIHFLSIMNNVTMNIHVQVFWWTYVSISSRTQEIPRSEIAGHVIYFYLTF